MEAGSVGFSLGDGVGVGVGEGVFEVRLAKYVIT
jgi:hypothetical protein